MIHEFERDGFAVPFFFVNSKNFNISRVKFL